MRLTVQSKKTDPVAQTKLHLIGVGETACQTINWLQDKRIRFLCTALSAYKSSLEFSKADQKIPLDSKQGFLSEEAQIRLTDTLKKSEAIYIVASLGNETETRACIWLANEARKHRVDVLMTVSMPGIHASKEQKEVAKKGLSRLKKHAHHLTVIEMADARFYPHITMGKSFLLLADTLLKTPYPKLKQFLKIGQIASVGFGLEAGEKRTENAIKEALGTAFLFRDRSKKSAILLHIDGGRDFTDADLQLAIKTILKEENVQVFASHTIGQELWKVGAVRVAVCCIEPKKAKKHTSQP